jgi:hypothetical protein
MSNLFRHLLLRPLVANAPRGDRRLSCRALARHLFLILLFEFLPLIFSWLLKFLFYLSY